MRQARPYIEHLGQEPVVLRFTADDPDAEAASEVNDAKNRPLTRRETEMAKNPALRGSQPAGFAPRTDVLIGGRRETRRPSSDDFEKQYPELRDEHLKREAVAGPEREKRVARARIPAEMRM